MIKCILAQRDLICMLVIKTKIRVMMSDVYCFPLNDILSLRCICVSDN
jgi:hypothetical protein